MASPSAIRMLHFHCVLCDGDFVSPSVLTCETDVEVMQYVFQTVGRASFAEDDDVTN